MEEEKVVLVDLDNQPIGTMGKMEAHEKALLHRAFSVFVMNSKNELLIQQRAFDKYHSPGLWTNTCCSHQREGASNIEAGNRRLIQEMGMNLPLEELFTFVYKASFDNVPKLKRDPDIGKLTVINGLKAVEGVDYVKQGDLYKMLN